MHRLNDDDARRGAARILGVAPDAGDEVARRAYRALARVHHPDLGGTTARFQALQTAWQVWQATAPVPASPAAATCGRIVSGAARGRVVPDGDGFVRGVVVDVAA